MTPKKLILVSLFIISCAGQLPVMPNIGSTKERQKSEKLPPCSSCKKFITSFNLGLEKTSRGKHEGGDANWEEEKLKSFKTSEVRLVEIQENLCKSLGRGENQCHRLAEDHEEEIEDWWFNHQNEFPDFFNWFCVDKLKFCCPDNHYGPDCEPCTSCFGNGKCRGNGTRLGNGKCACDIGYTGQNCDQCDLIHYEAFRDESKLLCIQCHSSCGNDGCFGAGPKSCRTCRPGWTMDADSGCIDLNECGGKITPCTDNQFCVNNEGSYSCLDCDKSCVECTGDGPDLCKQCADGFELREGICTDLTNEKRSQYVNYTRYITYFGLCIATCIIFKSATVTTTGLVGLAVAVYISLSEYWIQFIPEPKSPNQQILDNVLHKL